MPPPSPNIKTRILAATSPKAVAAYSLVIVAIESFTLWKGRDVLGNLWELPFLSVYVIIQMVLCLFFWHTLLTAATRSALFSLTAFLIVILDCLLEKYCIISYGTTYGTVISSAFNTTPAQVATYATPAVAIVFLLGIGAAVVFAISAGLRRHSMRKKAWALALFAAAVIVPLLLCKARMVHMPDAAYFLSGYKMKNGQWATWIGKDVMLGEGLTQNPVFRVCVDREHPEDHYLPFLREYWWLKAAAENFFPPDFQDPAADASECMLGDGDEITVVLYIVESFRADHSPFAGYHRNTLPNLYGKCRGNMIALPNVRSFGTHTRDSLYGMLSDANERNREAKHSSFLSLFRKHKYHSVLIENCTDTAEVTTIPLFRALLQNSCDNHIVVAKNNDFAALTREHLTMHRRNICTIFDGYGHHPYREESGNVWGDDIVSLYDEARLTIDKAAYRFIESIRDKTAIALIISDHGESFGECGRWCHGSSLAAEEQRQSFAAIWYSDAYARRFPEIVQNLRDNAEAFNSHDQIFHTMPSLGGIHSSLRDPSMDMSERQQATQNAVKHERAGTE